MFIALFHIKNLFGRMKKNDLNSNIKPRAVAFIDYEHWYISLDRLYKARPDIKGWYAEMSEQYDVGDVFFFADFSNKSLIQEIPRIREISNFVIDTQNIQKNHKKDFTDFIMLDHIYQKAMEASDIETFIIFSGDGHFSSVASFLSVKMNKTVGIYGVRDAISNQLRNSATWTKEITGVSSAKLRMYKMILNNIKNITENAPKGREPRIGYHATVLKVAKLNQEDAEMVQSALDALIANGYVIKEDSKSRDRATNGRGKIQLLEVNWDKVKNDGILSD